MDVEAGPPNTSGDMSGGGTRDGSGTGAVSSTGKVDPSIGEMSSSGEEGNESSGGNAVSIDLPPVDCTVDDALVAEDAFLIDCGEACQFANYGSTEWYRLTNDAPNSRLLLRLPNPSEDAVQVDLTLTVSAVPAALASGYTLRAFPIQAPCEWVPGWENGLTPQADAGGVTLRDCDADIPWEAPFDEALGHPDLQWDFSTVDIKADAAGDVIEMVISIYRSEGPGPTPSAILLSSDVPGKLEFGIHTAESAYPIWSHVTTEC